MSLMERMLDTRRPTRGDSPVEGRPLLERTTQALRLALPMVRRSHNVKSLSVFGSVARGEAVQGSDVDILVRFHGEPPGFFDFLRLERQLADAIGLPVDLVMESALKPRLRDRILSEAVDA